MSAPTLSHFQVLGSGIVGHIVQRGGVARQARADIAHVENASELLGPARLFARRGLRWIGRDGGRSKNGKQAGRDDGGY
jgi:hypothetical protein